MQQSSGPRDSVHNKYNNNNNDQIEVSAHVAGGYFFYDGKLIRDNIVMRG